MTTKTRAALGILLLLIAASGISLLWTGRGAADLAWRTSDGRAAPAGDRLVPDRTPLETARRLAALAATPEERALAQEAIRLADHELDLAFAEALRGAAENPHPESEEVQRLKARLQNARTLLEEDEARVARLTSSAAGSTGDRRAALEDELELAKAQVELDRDEIEDARQDLMRAGGDPEGRLKQMAQEHEEKTQVIPSAVPAREAVEEESAVAGLFHGARGWIEWREKGGRIERARRAAEEAVARLAREHAEFEDLIAAEAALSPELAKRAGQAAPGAGAGGDTAADREALVHGTRHLSSDRKALAALGRRIAGHQELASVYARWGALAGARQRRAMGGVFTDLLLILTIVAASVLLNWWLDRLVRKVPLERRRSQQLRSAARVALRVAATLVILLIFFGPPRQLATVLGLAGAGLTVALKDFIVGFIGWFVLMGRNGIRLGDWVEIKGVTGEVVELGVLHTILLETGNWAQSGHPTGRRVTFVNSFAIEGHYFNFSTSGQWLWDELVIHLPAGQDPYRAAEVIAEAAAAETRDGARLAEREWRGVAHSKELRTASGDPSIRIRPVPTGYEVMVRYVTRANERHLVRASLYQAVTRLIGATHGTPPPAPATPSPAVRAGADPGH